MEVARLLHEDVCLEDERMKYEHEGRKWPEIERILNDRYRKHSDKNAFTCKCCGKPVRMVLASEKTCHFRHLHEDPCPGKENYGVYRKKVTEQENEYKHKVGKAILREYMEGQLKIHGVEIKDGYVFAKKLRIVPDLLLYFPNGSVWAIDYVTGTKEDESYHHYIKKRIATYQESGFRPFFFIDKSWLSVHPETEALSLYLAETQMMERTAYDQMWEAALQRWIHQYGHSIGRAVFPNFASIPPLSYQVNSLVYLDPTEGEGYVTRFVPINSKWVHLIHQTSAIPIERIVSLNPAKNGFTLCSDHETEAINQLESKIIAADQQFKEAQRLREQRFEQERKRAETEQHSSFEVPLHRFVPAQNEQGKLKERELMIINKAKQKFYTHQHRLTSYNLKKYSEIFEKAERGETITPQELILLTSLYTL